MPLYAYECQDCGEQSEVIQKFSDAPLTKCESCGGRLRKLLSTPSFHLKGGGWYADGYGSKGGSGDSGKSADTKADASPSSTTGSDDKKSAKKSAKKSDKKSDKKASKKAS